MDLIYCLKLSTKHRWSRYICSVSSVRSVAADLLSAATAFGHLVMK